MPVNLDHIIVVGDKVLIKPKSHDKTTKSGLYLPPGVKEKEAVQSGYVVKIGPGYPIPMQRDNDESWKPNKQELEYFPLQCREGDLAVYLQRDGYEIEIDREKYFIVPQHAILLLIRNED
jgi:co-chaperonin GroES (HSP10)